jgi:hypothetical protein
MAMAAPLSSGAAGSSGSGGHVGEPYARVNLLTQVGYFDNYGYEEGDVVEVVEGGEEEVVDLLSGSPRAPPPEPHPRRTPLESAPWPCAALGSGGVLATPSASAGVGSGVGAATAAAALAAGATFNGNADREASTQPPFTDAVRTGSSSGSRTGASSAPASAEGGGVSAPPRSRKGFLIALEASSGAGAARAAATAGTAGSGTGCEMPEPVWVPVASFPLRMRIAAEVMLGAHAEHARTRPQRLAGKRPRPLSQEPNSDDGYGGDDSD